MELPSYFNTFLQNIRPTPDEQADYQKGHTELREKIHEDKKIQELLITTFLQGSYRRFTAIKAEAGQRSDVDIVVVTKISPKDSPQKALEYFEPFCQEHYEGKWKRNDRSIGIELDKVSLDLVVTAAPSEAEEGLLKSANWLNMTAPPRELNEARLIKGWMALGGPTRIDNAELRKIEAASQTDWRSEPLLIPDRKFLTWEETHPISQIEWTWEKNFKCNDHYLGVVKAIKWWKRIKGEQMPKYPKGYPLEHLIGAACPDDIDSVAQGITETFENILRRYPTKPVLPDHGVPSHDVMKRVSNEEYAKFITHIRAAAQTARKAFDIANDIEASAKYWIELFGDEFPSPEPDEEDPGSRGFTKRTEVTTVGGGGRFA